jgi:nucleotide-binding universal stress UspA family protein
MEKLESILVPVTFSPTCQLALKHAQTMAERFGAKVDVLHVCDPDKVRGTDDVAVAFRGVPGSTLEVNSELEVQRRLTDFLKSSGFDREARNDEIEQGKDVAEVIVEVAKKKGYGLIVMGTTGKRGLSALVAGTVALKVVQTAPCPVLTCRTMD